MSPRASEEAFPLMKPLFAVLNKKTAQVLLVVEAADAQEAKLRANWVAPFFGWRHFEEDELQQVDEVPDRTPTFFENYFAGLGSLSETLH
jgi:hypothetical protein